MKNRPGLKQYIFAALGIVILVLLDQYTKLLAIAHLKDQSAFVLWNNVFELHYLVIAAQNHVRMLEMLLLLLSSYFESMPHLVFWP